MKIKQIIVVSMLFLFGLFVDSTKAQAVSSSPPSQIDSTTYRHFFVASTADHSTLPGTTMNGVPVLKPEVGISDRQLQYLRTAGLNEEDAILAAGILLDFRSQYDTLITNYNNSPETKAGTNINTPAVLFDIETAVQTARSRLSDSISAAGVINLDTYIASIYIPSGNVDPVVNGCTITPNYASSITATQIEKEFPWGTYVGLPISSGLTYYNEFELSVGPTGRFGTTGLDTDTSVGGAYFILNFTVYPQPLNKAIVTMTAAGSTAQWGVWYSDNFKTPAAGPFYKAIGGVGAPTLSSTIIWPSVGTHAVWKFVLENTPGTGPDWTQLRLFDGPYVNATALVDGTSTVSGSTCGSMTASGYAQHYFDSFFCNAQGPSLSLTSYISVADLSTTFVATTDAATHSIPWYVNVITAGVFLYQQNGTEYARWSRTMSKCIESGIQCVWVGSPGAWFTGLISYCTVATSPPDYNPALYGPSFIRSASVFYLGYGFVVRFTSTGPWITTYGFGTTGWDPGIQGWTCDRTP